jgi:hypothetical protein
LTRFRHLRESSSSSGTSSSGFTSSVPAPIIPETHQWHSRSKYAKHILELRNPISRKLLNRPPSHPKCYSAQTAIRALRPGIRAQRLTARQDPKSKRTSRMDVHIGGALCQNMDPIRNKQGSKITKFLCTARNMEREKTRILQQKTSNSRRFMSYEV